jgi:hypothetical protein
MNTNLEPFFEESVVEEKNYIYFQWNITPAHTAKNLKQTLQAVFDEQKSIELLQLNEISRDYGHRVFWN